MEFDLSVNEVLTENVTKLNYTVIPAGLQDHCSVKIIKEELCEIIDSLGELSAANQNLSKPITTAEKLQKSPTCILYLLKDPKAKEGKGDVIGLLRVDRKRLFMYDENNTLREIEPMCVLDFHVVSDRQRQGNGKTLFEYMLQDLKTSPVELAIDGPSNGMKQFLAKYYGIDRLVEQNNKFAVSPQIFSLVPSASKSGRSTPTLRSAVGRYTAQRPLSKIGAVIHGAWINSEEYKRTSESASLTGLDMDPENEVHEANDKPEETPKTKGVTVEELVENQKSPERPSTLKVEPMVESPPPELSPAESTASHRDSQLTDRGYFDMKFYHNKLW